MKNRIQAYFEARSARESGPSGPAAAGPSPYAEVRVLAEHLPVMRGGEGGVVTDAVYVRRGSVVEFPRAVAEALAEAGEVEILG